MSKCPICNDNMVPQVLNLEKCKTHGSVDIDNNVVVNNNEILKKLLSRSNNVTIMPMLKENLPFDRRVVFLEDIVEILTGRRGYGM